ncbi:MAG: helix-turn-helix transcriptional regulator [Acidothermaceae bacterium]
MSIETPTSGRTVNLPRTVHAHAGMTVVDDDGAEGESRGSRGGPRTSSERAQLSREITAERRRLLGEFIRSRRERTTPDMVGMAPGLRRRTPGLRREEVALLSGIGITWYTWLEQGRPINVSSQVLQSVARVLHLDPTERAHIFALAGLPDPEQTMELPRVGSAVQAMLDQLAPMPAVVFGPHWEILASNRAYLGLVGDYTELPSGCRNTLWMCFTDPYWRTLHPDWSEVARRLVAKMRGAMAEHVGDPGWNALLDLMQQHSREFREMWRRNEVAPMDNCFKQLMHAEAGRLDIEADHLWLSDQRNVRMMVYTPRNDETRERFNVLMRLQPRRLPQPPGSDNAELTAS